jgi:hypothetical protein
MSPKKKKTAKDRKIKKEKNLKDPPAEDLFTADWPAISLRSNKTLEKVSHPATISDDTSRLTLLQGESGGTANSPPTPVDKTPNNSEIKSSDSLTSSENKDNKGKLANYLSAVSGSSPNGSTVECNCSETDSNYSYKYPSSGDESFIPFNQDDTSKLLARILPLSSALPCKKITYTGKVSLIVCADIRIYNWDGQTSSPRTDCDADCLAIKLVKLVKYPFFARILTAFQL